MGLNNYRTPSNDWSVLMEQGQTPLPAGSGVATWSRDFLKWPPLAWGGQGSPDPAISLKSMSHSRLRAADARRGLRYSFNLIKRQ